MNFYQSTEACMLTQLDNFRSNNHKNEKLGLSVGPKQWQMVSKYWFLINLVCSNILRAKYCNKRFYFSPLTYFENNFGLIFGVIKILIWLIQTFVLTFLFLSLWCWFLLVTSFYFMTESKDWEKKNHLKQYKPTMITKCWYHLTLDLKAWKYTIDIIWDGGVVDICVS